jgi:hypothetical protein
MGCVVVCSGVVYHFVFACDVMHVVLCGVRCGVSCVLHVIFVVARYTLLVLAQLASHSGVTEVTEDQVIAWANQKVTHDCNYDDDDDDDDK